MFTEEQIFYRGGSAALFVMSPFQLLCAREAVEEFQFDEYKYVFLLSPRTSKRNEQMLQMANEWGIEYDQYDASTIVLNDFIAEKGLFDIKNRLKKFDRIFSGDFWSPECRMLANNYAKENAIVSFVDDGTASIYVLRGEFCVGMQSGSWADFLKWHHLKHSTYKNLKIIDDKLRKYKIDVSDSFFSVYSDVRPTKFITRQNSFRKLLSKTNKDDVSEETVYFIGSPSDDFCTMFGIDMDYLNEIVYTQLSDVCKRYAGDKIIYIPHPRDINPQIPRYCKELRIEYTSLGQPAEDFIRSHNKNVLAVFGFGSSTLINLKRMFPDMPVVDIIIKNPRKKQYNRRADIINDYYKQNGIEMVKVIIPQEKNKIKPISLKQNIVGLINYFVGGFK